MRIVQAVVIAIVVALVCLLLGAIISTLPFPIAAVVGGFLTGYAYVLGILAGLWHFAVGGGWGWPRPAPPP